MVCERKKIWYRLLMVLFREFELLKNLIKKEIKVKAKGDVS